jgi:hypothetical protein
MHHLVANAFILEGGKHAQINKILIRLVCCSQRGDARCNVILQLPSAAETFPGRYRDVLGRCKRAVSERLAERPVPLGGMAM